VVDDQHGCPTCARDIAAAVFAVDGALESGASPWGLYHFAGTGSTTWHGFAAAIVEAQSAWTGRSPIVTAIPTALYPTAARRPLNSRLDSSLFAATFGYKAVDWHSRTTEIVNELAASEGGVSR
jgi:dTDP-4-dehydrorhamnose reductase